MLIQRRTVELKLYQNYHHADVVMSLYIFMCVFISHYAICVWPEICCLNKVLFCSILIGWLCWGLTSQSTIFQSCRDGAITSWVINQYFRGVKCLAQGHNTAAVGLEPRTSRSGVRHYSDWFSPFSPSGVFRPYQLEESICKFRGVWCTFSFLFYFEQKSLQANSEDPYQTPRSVSKLFA